MSGMVRQSQRRRRTCSDDFENDPPFIRHKVRLWYPVDLKITVDLAEKELRDICRITGISKKGPAIRKLLNDALTLQRRAEISGKFISSEWGTDLSGIEASEAADKAKSLTFAEQWRD